MKTSWNKELIKKMSRNKFVRTYKDIYREVDLGSVYDDIVPPEKKEDVNEYFEKKKD